MPTQHRPRVLILARILCILILIDLDRALLVADSLDRVHVPTSILVCSLATA